MIRLDRCCILIPFLFLDILIEQMETRFSDASRYEALIITPAGIVEPKLKENIEQWMVDARSALERWEPELPDHTMINTELRIWFRHWYVRIEWEKRFSLYLFSHS